MELKGIGASSGIAIAKVFELVEAHVEIKKEKANIEQETQKLESAIKDTIAQIEQIKKRAAKNLDAEHAAVFDAHIQVASDPMMIDEVKGLIKSEEANALWATNEVFGKYAEMFASMEDAYMKERAADIKDVAKRVINSIAGVKSSDVSAIDEEVIVVGEDLTPSDTAQLNKKFAKGFATNIGGRTSHSAIMARSLEIPAVLGLKDITEKVKTGDTLIIDGDEGIVIINPTEAQVSEYKEKQEALAKEAEELKAFIGKESKTADGHEVELAGNIGSPNDVAGVLENDGEAVGLFRSEFLYMDASDWPTEEEQFESYKSVLSNMKGHRVVVRTLDIGGDKTLSYYKFPEEMNPFLGYRAIRLCLDQVEVFKTQLRALVRASKFGKLAIMFPMIATIDEFKKAKSILEEVHAELVKEGHEVAPMKDIEVGMMVEVPAAAANAERFAKYADFFSIGTNDLMQYTMAADRMSEKVSYLYQPLNPSILNLIKMTIDGAHAQGKWVGMCGEMAGDKNAVPVLVGLGLDEFSMSATSILKARKQISEINLKDAQALAAKAVVSETESDVQALVEEFNKK
ncbi:phosphoenolpyruvate--protein phosphotransferase [Mycoplasma marinum]|uniref:Phosphoenolpyruvate-protein phosphotransferase n=1 Tax=Mycoplasma marinum TaxID=1937190 RepID=A0A4V2NI60_9MOLU|nr:phosphoenolpyruvate--protein phosphotransferase [Mycoplasma marinum]TCG11638.1 phosphoenolpyruvate--protein phosphotransferase [Mycoplasma marinum]